MKFRIGNGLRGHVTVEADSIKEGWDKGRAAFEKMVPSTPGGLGRTVFLGIQVEKHGIASEGILNSHYINKDDPVEMGYLTIYNGCTREELSDNCLSQLHEIYNNIKGLL